MQLILFLFIALVGAAVAWFAWNRAVQIHGRKIIPWSTEAKLVRKIKAEADLQELIFQSRMAEAERKELITEEWDRRFKGQDE